MGEQFWDGKSRQVTQSDLRLYDNADETQAKQLIPLLQRSNDPHEYMFFALFDGTGQDANNPKQPLTNIGQLRNQLDKLDDDPSNRIGYEYVEGIGTQGNPLTRVIDGAVPYTWDDKIERAYRALAIQTSEWQRQDPHAQIRIVGVGYSRGAVLAPGLARLVDQYGIVDPNDLEFGRDAHGNITIESPRAPLVAPGQAAQVMGLFDPVGTYMPANYDTRLPPSVIGALSMTAAHEQREKFPHQTVIDPGLSPDQRFANLLVPGGHSNVGGGNRSPGLETLAFNRMADYLNGLSDHPIFQYRPLPDDPNQYSVYQAHGLPSLAGMDRDGVRNFREELANCKIVDPCRDAEAVDQTLAARFEYRQIPVDGAQTRQVRALLENTHRVEAPAQGEAPGTPEPRTVVPPAPEHLKDFRSSGHPQNGRYLEVLEAVHAMEARASQPSGPHSERIAAALTAQLDAQRLEATQAWPFERFGALDRVELQGDQIVAVERTVNASQPHRDIRLPVVEANAHSVEQVSADWARLRMPHLGQPQTAPEPSAAPGPRELSEYDWRRPDHPMRARYETLREQVAATYAQAGLVRSEEQIDHATAAVATSMQRHGLTRADHLFLSQDASGIIGPDSSLTVLQGRYPQRLLSETPGEALVQAPEQSFQQLQQIAAQQAVERQQSMQREAVQPAVQQQAPMLA